ncbi:MAG: hypothetical protein ACKVU1_12880 [bacterium]
MRAFVSRGRAAAWVLLTAVAMAVNAVGAGGCFFNPRDSEPPETLDTLATRWRQPNTPEILINNVRVTFEDRQIDRYRLGFRADWKFIPDKLDSIDLCSQSECPFDNYTRATEEEVAQNLFTTNDRIPISFFFTPESIFEVSSDTARVRLAYEFTLIDSAPDGGAPGVIDSSSYAGILEFFMRDEGSGWALYAWQDIRSGESGVKSWGELRGRTRS